MQKQPAEKFFNIHRETPVLETLANYEYYEIF